MLRLDLGVAAYGAFIARSVILEQIRPARRSGDVHLPSYTTL